MALPRVCVADDEATRRYLVRLLSSERPADVLAAIADREPITLDQRLLAYGARLAMDAWELRPWTGELLTRLTGMPSTAWHSVLLAVDAGVPESAWVLPHAMDQQARRALASMNVPYLTLVAAACLPDRLPLPPDCDPSVASLVGRLADARTLLGDIAPPWSEDFGEPFELPSGMRDVMRRVRDALDASELAPLDEPEIRRVLDGELADDEADWILHTLDAAAAQLADRYEPQLRSALPPALRDAWRREWRDFALGLVRSACSSEPN